MPELPEVETVRKQLIKILPFEIVEISTSKFVKSILKTKLDILNDTVTGIDRHGKFLIFKLKSERLLLSHLGMSGSWRISNYPSKEKHTHLSLRSHNCYLFYVDPRRFGNLYLMTQKELEKKLKTLGPDPLHSPLTSKTLQQIFKKYPERELKPLLLDQSLIAGIGNYMASEICARAGVKPTKKVGKISSDQILRITQSIDLVIDLALKGQGTTFLGGYKDTEGKSGEGKLQLVVFRQKVCGLCKKSPIKQLTQNSRTTFYCVKCQK